MLRRPASLLLCVLALSAVPALAAKDTVKTPANQNETNTPVPKEHSGAGSIGPTPTQSPNPTNTPPPPAPSNTPDQSAVTENPNPTPDETTKTAAPSDVGGGISTTGGRFSGGGAGPEPPPASQPPGVSEFSREGSWGAAVARSSFGGGSTGGLEGGMGRSRQFGGGVGDGGGSGGETGQAWSAAGSRSGLSAGRGGALGGQGAPLQASVISGDGFRLGSKVDFAALGRSLKERVYGGGPTSQPGRRRLDSREAALAEWERAVQRNPNDPFALTRRGEAYYALKRYDLALADSGRAVRADRRNAAAWRLAAMAYYKTGDMDRALRSADEAIRLKPTDAMGYLVRAYLRHAAGDIEGALADLEAAALLDPRYAAILERAKAGNGIVDPYDASTLDAELKVKVRASRLAPVAGLIGGAFALALLVVLGGWGLGRRTRRSAFAAKYTLDRKLGQGGMGEVYLANDRQLGRPVAVKKISDDFLRSNSSARRLFLREARTAAAAHHPGIVEVYEIVEDRRDVYLVFELVNGRTLREVLQESGAFSLADALRVLKPLGEALDFAHGRGLVHRDLKPANLMITEHGRVKIMDFGIARRLDENTTPLRSDEEPSRGASGMTAAQTRAAGTRPYMAPEAFDGQVLRQGDVYALGVLAYELLTGHLPDRAASGAPTPAALADPALTPLAARALARAMSPRPEDRPASAGRFVTELTAART